MIGFLKNMAHSLFSDEEPSQPTGEFVERRGTARLGFCGREVPVWSSELKTTLRLKDLSCGGVSGITALPAAVGERVGIELPLVGKQFAYVRWVKSTSIGLRFETPLTLMTVARLFAMHWDSARPFKLGGSQAGVRGSSIAINDDERESEQEVGAAELQL